VFTVDIFDPVSNAPVRAALNTILVPLVTVVTVAVVGYVRHEGPDAGGPGAVGLVGVVVLVLLPPVPLEFELPQVMPARASASAAASRAYATRAIQQFLL
jgi:hypothetical protein